MEAYNLDISDVAKKLKTDLESGLTEEQVLSAQKKYGPNILSQKEEPSLLSNFFEQFKNPLIYLLVSAAIIITLLQNYTDALVTVIVILINTSVGAFHEINVRNTLNNLKKIIKISCIVVRDDKKQIINAAKLVPGDLIILKEGDRVPADSRLIFTRNLLVNESILTGESKSQKKTFDKLEGEKKVFERTNTVFSGTMINSGSASAIVTSTGELTEIGKIQKSVDDFQVNSPLKREIDKLSSSLLKAILILCSALLLIGIILGQDFQDLLFMITALFVGVIPEGLPAALTIILTLGAFRLASKKVLVKNLQATEGLGRTDILVIDKTGTLTRNELMIKSVYNNGNFYQATGEGYFSDGGILGHETIPDNLKYFRDAAGLLDSSEKKYDSFTKNFQIRGEPIEAALGVFAKKLGFESSSYKKIYSLPFNTSIRANIGIFEKANLQGEVLNRELITFISGVPEAILKLAKNHEEGIKKAFEEIVSSGMRVVAIAFIKEKIGKNDKLSRAKQISKNIIKKLSLRGLGDKQNIKEQEGQEEQELSFPTENIALVGISDSIRSKVDLAVLRTQEAGTDIIMATGDHKITADLVARRTKILKEDDISMSGEDFFSEKNQKFVLENIDKLKVLSRVLPKDKLKLVDILRKKDKIVAMTGDGINDIPAILAADIGISMGSGTDATKEAADVVLLDDNFSGLLRSIKEGRHIMRSIRRIVWYSFSTNLSELIVISLTFLMGVPIPLRAAQILWLNLVTDGFLDLGLAAEPHEKDLLNPKKRHSKIIDYSLLGKILFDALIMTVGTIFVFLSFYKTNLAVARTITLICMSFFQWFNVWNCRSENTSIFKINFFKNKWLLLTICFVFLLQIMVVYVPFLQLIFKTVPLNFSQWVIAIAVSSSILISEEIRKYVASAKYR